MKVLAILYTQSGQLSEITNKFLVPLSETADIDYVEYTPKKAFPFPWNSAAFWDAMPESVLDIPIELNPIKYKYQKYDLIIFAYQPWFLSPSIPTNSILQDATFKTLLKNTPVVTLIGSRNMWINSQDRVRTRINEAGGKLIGNIPLIDRSQNHISAFTILHWMLTAKKTRKWGVFPLPGISQKDIDNVAKYGEVLKKAIEKKDYDTLQYDFLSLKMIYLGTDILFIERKAKSIFKVWATLIKKLGTSDKGRKIVVAAFKYYLILALFIISPVIIVLYYLLIVPFIFRRIKKRKDYICSKI